VSPIEQRIREFLNKKRRVGPAVASNIVRLNKWILSVQAEGLDADRVAAKAEIHRTGDFIENLAETLIEHGSGTDRKLLLKSLQETFLYCVGFESNLTRAQFKVRFTRYLNREGVSPFMVRFLSLHFFNFVWFEIGESFRTLAWSSDSFVKDMEAVERICQKAVAAGWKKFEQSEQVLDITAALEIVRSIEQQLRGVQAAQTH
jgi:hypothetical protein